MAKFEVGFRINDDQYVTVVNAKNQSEAFCMARNKAEREYFRGGATCTAIQSIDHPDSYVKPYYFSEKDLQDCFDTIDAIEAGDLY